MSSNPSGSNSSIRSLKYTAAVGLAPPVEIPAQKSPRSTRAGNRKLLSKALSATFTLIWSLRHHRAARAFT